MSREATWYKDVKSRVKAAPHLNSPNPQGLIYSYYGTCKGRFLYLPFYSNHSLLPPPPLPSTTMSQSEMSMGGSSNSTGGMALWLHFTPGDVLLFQDWAPTTPGAVFGACIGLFMLAVVDRWLAALRRFMEIWWAER